MIWILAFVGYCDQKYDCWCAVISIIIMTVFAGLRHPLSWTDGEYYTWIFAHPFSMEKDIELGFRLWNHVCNIIFKNYNVYLILTYLSVFLFYLQGLRGLNVYRLSTSIAVIASCYYLSSGGLRQFIALSICFFSLQFVVNKQWGWFALCVFFASCIHRTSIILSIYPVLLKLKSPFGRVNFLNFIFLVLVGVYAKYFLIFEKVAVWITRKGILSAGVQYRVYHYLKGEGPTTLLSLGNVKRFVLSAIYFCMIRECTQFSDGTRKMTYIDLFNIYLFGVVLGVFVPGIFSRINLCFFSTEIFLEAESIGLLKKKRNRMLMFLAFGSLNMIIYIHTNITYYPSLFQPYRTCLW